MKRWRPMQEPVEPDSLAGDPPATFEDYPELRDAPKYTAPPRFAPPDTREHWLLNAGALLSAHVLAKAAKPVPPYCVSVGFPKGTRGRQRAIGQCWSHKVAADGRFHVFICPTLADAGRVLDVLLHELIHAAVGTEHGHKKPFSEAAKACGLVKPWTATTAGPELRERLNGMLAELGAYPHGALTPTSPEKKPGSRLRLWQCECGIKVRVASDSFAATCNLCGSEFTKE